MPDAPATPDGSAPHPADPRSLRFAGADPAAAARIGAGACVVLGLGVLLGWALDVELLMSVTPDGRRMVPYTALAFVVTGTAMLLGGRAVRTTAAALVAGWAAVTFVEYLVGAGSGFDALLTGTGYTADDPGRAYPQAVAAFLLLAAAMAFAGRPGLERVRAVAVSLAGVVTAGALIGHGLAVEGFYGLDEVPETALHTAVGLAVLTAVLALDRPDEPPLSWVHGDAPAVPATRLALAALSGLLVVMIVLIRVAEAADLDEHAAASLAVLVVLVGGVAGAVIGGRVLGESQRDRSLVAGRLAGVVDALREHAIFTIDGAGRIVSWNRGAEALTGEPQDAVLGRALPTFVAEVAGDVELHDAIREAQEQGIASAAGWWMRGDGVRFWAELTLTRSGDDTLAVVVHDASDSRSQELELRRSHARFEALLETMDGSVTELGHDLRVVYAAGPAWRTAGYDPREAIGRTLSELPTTPAGVGEIEELVARALKGEPGSFSWTSERAGRVYWLLAMPLRDRGGAVRSAILSAQDITARAAAEERFGALLEAAPDAIVIVDADGAIRLVNRALEALTGYARGELRGRPVETLVPAYGRETHRRHRVSFGRDPRQRPMGGGQELGVLHRSGRIVPVDISLSPLPGPDGDVVIVALRDVTDRRAAEAARREADARFTQAFAHAPIGKAVLDATGRVISSNHALQRLLQRPAELLHGQELGALLGTDLGLDVAGDGGRRRSVSVEVQRPDGRLLTVELSIGRLGEDTSAPGYVAQFVDLTDRERAIREARAAVAEAEAASRVKDEFLSRMSHELRTPLTAVVGFGELLVYALEGEQSRQAGVVVSAARHLAELVDDLLDFALVQSGRVGISVEPVSLAVVIDQVRSLLAPRFAQEEMLVAVPPGLAVRADVVRVRQILVNLLENARKYGAPPVALEVVDEPETGSVTILVRDHGNGIPPEQAARVFEPFERLDGSQEGTGLGLALSRGLAKAMGGTLDLLEADGAGAAFALRLPRATAVPVPAPSVDRGLRRDDDARGTVLHIDDNQLNVQLVASALALRPGVRLVSASDTAQGLLLAERTLPDLVLTDLHLPDGTGFELIDRMRSVPELRDTPVVVVSADASTASRRAAEAREAAGYLAKPYAVQELLDTIDRHLA